VMLIFSSSVLSEHSVLAVWHWSRVKFFLCIPQMESYPLGGAGVVLI
jgi:hypothetical protein